MWVQKIKAPPLPVNVGAENQSPTAGCAAVGGVRSLLWLMAAEGNRDRLFCGSVRPFDGLPNIAQHYSQVHANPP